MKMLIKLTLASVLALGTAYGALAAEFTKGTVKKIDAKAKKVTLMAKLKEGANVEFVAERVDGKLTVTEVK